VNMKTILEHHSNELNSLFRQLVKMEEAQRCRKPVPALSEDQTRQLILVVIDSLLTNRRQRLLAMDAKPIQPLSHNGEPDGRSRS
jgi:hemerythrin superfamily protein